MKSEPAASTAIVTVRPPAIVNIWDDVRLQRLWLAVDRREWRSLAVIGASSQVESIQVAELLAQLAWRYRGQPSSVCDLRDLSMRLVEYQARELQAQVAAGSRVVVALRPIFDNPTSAAICKQIDAAIVCIAIGETTTKQVTETVGALGRDRVIGSLVYRPRRPVRTP